ncbi:MAG: hypothetical protein ACRD5I_14680 [Candidatus Acidiferrales bacterium]
MKLRFFGDSHDIVKKSLLGWLIDFGPWAAHPMFTHAVSDAQATEFERFLGVSLISTAVLHPRSDRERYFATQQEVGSIFLDPDTGIRLKRFQGNLANRFIFADELARLTDSRPRGLTLTFDQSLARGREQAQLRRKLSHFRDLGIHGFAYVGQASFVVLGRSADLTHRAREQLLSASALPAHRVIDDIA